MNFCLPPKQLKYADYLVQFEFFYRDIRKLEFLSNEDLDFVKTETKEAALSSFRQYNKHPQQNLSFLQMSVKTRSDKGNSVVIVDKDTYTSAMSHIMVKVSDTQM